MADFLYNNVAQQIEDDIKGMAIGTKLPSERAMSVQYGVSRNVLREALRLLSEKGMLSSMPGKGVYVANDGKKKLTDRLEDLLLRNDSSLEDIVEVRQTLELGVMNKAIEKATPEDIKALMEIYMEMENSRNNIAKFNKYDVKFHIRLAKCTQNAIYPILVSSFFQLTDKKLFMLTQLYPVRVDSAQREHKLLIKAIQDKDLESGLQIGKKHFNIADILSGEIRNKK